VKFIISAIYKRTNSICEHNEKMKESETKKEFSIKQAFKTSLMPYLIILFFVFLMNNIITPYMADDYGGRVSGAFDKEIFSYLVGRYKGWSGRLVADFNAALFMGLPKIVFDIFNSVFAVLFFVLVTFHVVGARKAEFKEKLIIFFASIITTFFIFNDFGQIFLWLTGSVNYLWNMVFILAGLLPFRVYADSVRGTFEENNISTFIKKHKIFMPLIMLLCIISGCTNETTVCGLLFMMMILMIYTLIKSKKIPMFFVTGFITTLLGAVILIKAPGNYLRKDVVTEDVTLSKGQTIVNNVTSVLEIFLKQPGLLIVFLILLTLLFVLLFVFHEKRFLFITLLYAVSSFLMVAAYAGSGTAARWYRGVFGAFVFFMIAMLIPLSVLMQHERIFTAMKVVSGVCMSLIVLLAFYSSTTLFYNFYQENKRKAYVISQSTGGNTSIVLPELDYSYDSIWNPNMGDLSDTKDNWPNPSYAAYYGIDSVVVTDRKRWNLAYKDADPTVAGIISQTEYFEKAKENSNNTEIIYTGKNPSDSLKKFISDHGGDTDQVKFITIKGDSIEFSEEDSLSITVGWYIYNLFSNDKYSFITQTDIKNILSEDVSDSKCITLNQNGVIIDYCIFASDSDDITRK